MDKRTEPIEVLEWGREPNLPSAKHTSVYQAVYERMDNAQRGETLWFDLGDVTDNEKLVLLQGMYGARRGYRIRTFSERRDNGNLVLHVYKLTKDEERAKNKGGGQ